ncbi:MAG TPA: nucleotidyltransferase family protein [Candidatus Acidoferrales bacterium]|nr:nucleotidyltransferase family protein [Candidatus Acidoferrales bacterium]
MLAVAILAAGESRRMGTPKALLDYHGKTFVEHLIDVTQHPRVGLLRVVLGAKADDIRARIAVNPDAIIVNEYWQRGQLSSIQTAIRSLPEGATEGVMLCPVDHPVISHDVVAQLIAAFESTQKPVVIPSYKGRRGHPVIFRALLYDELLAASPDIGARQVVWAHANDIEEVPTDEGVILNLDDPPAYQNAIAKK